MKIDDDVWKFMQEHLGYTDEELELFRSNPKNAGRSSVNYASMKWRNRITVKNITYKKRALCIEKRL